MWVSKKEWKKLKWDIVNLEENLLHRKNVQKALLEYLGLTYVLNDKFRVYKRKKGEK